MENSHVIPKFVYRWLIESSGTGYLRFGEKPNLRVQDGFKRYWLCPSCEDLLSTQETAFARKVFRPLIEDAATFEYQEWLLKFAVSLTWRVLLLLVEEDELPSLTPELKAEVGRALEQWRAFLIGDRPSPGKYEQHMVPMGPIVSYGGDDLPTNINRYILRSVDLDVGHSPEEFFVYVKLPYVMLVGFIEIKHPEYWRGTKLHVRHGTLGATKYVIPQSFGSFMTERARRVEDVQASISEAQRKKIREDFRKAIDSLPESGSFKAMDADVKLFGKRAFREKRDS